PSPPNLRVIISTFPTEEAAEILPYFEAPLQKLAEPAAQSPRFGAASKRLRKGSTRVALVMLDAPAELPKLPRTLALGASANIAGKWLDSGLAGNVKISDVTGHVE